MRFRSTCVPDTQSNKGPADIVDGCQGTQFAMTTNPAELDQFFSSALNGAGVATNQPDVTLTAVKKTEDSNDGKC